MAWEMPQVFVGQEIMFYPYAKKRIEDAQRGVVKRVWEPNRAIQIQLSGFGVSRISTQCVRHIDDPHFEAHPEAGAHDGAWDFTPYDLYTKARIEALEQKVDSLEAIIDGLQSTV